MVPWAFNLLGFEFEYLNLRHRGAIRPRAARLSGNVVVIQKMNTCSYTTLRPYIFPLLNKDLETQENSKVLSFPLIPQGQARGSSSFDHHPAPAPPSEDRILF